ncbi:Predicted lipoprotein [Pseudarcicella hirudinis]|uniref:Predicted lipoprotein n=1 Tax=Pseudarcicella hirudinis TaxID=1079859 RepID=A0A1I5SRC8_9BACT|nr:DUF2279 domain-containing protein [Pseudarcicella hirudinis]SFP73289.1 Predicted lipoprotein [Pseudarcicella hirudinis]
MRCSFNFNKYLIGVLLFFYAQVPDCAAQSDSTQTKLNAKRLRGFIIGESVGYVGTLAGLGSAWYGDKTSAFHFFDDNYEWLQIDKLGHLYTAYNLCRVSNQGFLWTGLSRKKSAVYGAVSGAAFMTTIEILDGFQSEYGFSLGDMAANVVGPGLFLGQELLWGETRIQPKWSFHHTSYAKLYPNKLGSSWNEEWLKDYNGQTYWFSANIYKFLPKGSKFPKWLNIAAGYGVENMVNADPVKSIAEGYAPYRQYYLALDVNLQHFKTKSRLLNTLIFILDQIKIPAPTLEYNSKGGFIFHGLYF